MTPLNPMEAKINVETTLELARELLEVTQRHMKLNGANLDNPAIVSAAFAGTLMDLELQYRNVANTAVYALMLHGYGRPRL